MKRIPRIDLDSTKYQLFGAKAPGLFKRGRFFAITGSLHAHSPGIAGEYGSIYSSVHIEGESNLFTLRKVIYPSVLDEWSMPGRSATFFFVKDSFNHKVLYAVSQGDIVDPYCSDAKAAIAEVRRRIGEQRSCRGESRIAYLCRTRVFWGLMVVACLPVIIPFKLLRYISEAGSGIPGEFRMMQFINAYEKSLAPQEQLTPKPNPETRIIQLDTDLQKPTANQLGSESEKHPDPSEEHVVTRNTEAH